MALVTIAAFRDPLEAQLARMRLEGSGISCFLLHYGLRLRVSEKDVGRARDILEDPGSETDSQ